MNKLTLLSLSLLMISACNAIEDNQEKQETQEQKSDLKLTRRVLGMFNNIKTKKLEKFFDGGLSSEGYRIEVNQDKRISSGKNDYIHPLRIHFILRRRKGANGLRTALNRLYPDKRKVTITVVTEFDIHGAENIKQFEKEYNFREDKPTDGTFFNRHHARDDKISCEVRRYLDEDTNHRSYECVIDDTPLNEFEDILDELETQKK